MKRITALICLLAMVLPLCACSSDLATKNTVNTAEETSTQAKNGEKGEIVYPDSFAVGFSRVDITPATPIPVYDTTADGVNDPLWLTCTAIWDGKQAALIYSVDSWFVGNTTAESAFKKLEKEFGIPSENIMLNSTHSHSAPNVSTSENPDIIRYFPVFYKQVVVAAEEALRDLDVVEKTYTGRSYTEGITFVRRYLMGDGTYKGIASSNPSNDYKAHETEADNEMRTIRFDRKNKKDVLMLNHQTHYGGAPSLYPDKISADFITPLREKVEDELDCLFAYQYGASGNLNFISNIPGERKYASYPQAVPALAQYVKDAVSAEKEISVGEIRAMETKLTATVKKDSEERIAKAQEIADASHNEALQGQLCRQYGFEAKNEASAVLTRSRSGETQDLPLSVITFGDVCFAAFPYEMFDTSGVQVRNDSPFETTFICSLTNGAFGYLPNKEVFPHGCYEVYVSRYVEGTAELCVAEAVRMLNDCKNAA